MPGILCLRRPLRSAAIAAAAALGPFCAAHADLASKTLPADVVEPEVTSATPAQAAAKNAAIADGLSTAAALATGAREVNPLGPVIAIAVKPLVIGYIKTLPEEQQASSFAIVGSIWGGAAANNICITAVMLTGGGAAPACLVVGAAWGIKMWKDTEHERTFWEKDCPTLRRSSGNPDLTCMYTEPPQEPSFLARTNSDAVADTAPPWPAESP